MTPGKRLRIFTVALFAFFTALSTLSYGADCGFGSCQNTVPPCYKVVFSGVRRCHPNFWCDYCDCMGNCEGDFAYSFNQTWFLSYYEDCKWLGWRFIPDIGEEGGDWPVELELNGGATWIGDHDCYFFCGTGPHGTGSCENDYDGCCCQCFPPPGECGYVGVATYEPIWDCNYCDKCDANLTITVSDYDNPIHYGNKDCCPVGKGECEPIKFSCDDAHYVISIYKIEVTDPNDPNTWLEVDSSELVKVTPPNDCYENNTVTFRVQALEGHPPAKAKVTCTAVFFASTGETNSETVTIDIEPGCGTCCDPPFTCPVPIL